MLVFEERGKPEYPEKTSRSKDENQQQTQPTYDAEPRIEPGPHWWEASALTNAQSLIPTKGLSKNFDKLFTKKYNNDHSSKTGSHLYTGIIVKDKNLK